ncbi:MAG TPA: molybdopterin-synthase adenylyltransferase MoeB [Thermoanaerobaculia bacterium]|nr:molybdopterin-synthase adenylyltransferase MoeB [Thermoanaerobaculia bacterium]
MADSLTQEEWSRYARHVSLPEVGREGQERLKAGSVLVVGAGGLGSPAALYLAAAGIGRLGVADFDRVEQSNLQRQILHGTSAVGTSKLDSAAARLRDLNPNVAVETHPTRLDSGNAMEILRSYDVIVDGSDNFPTRYLINDAAVLLGKPNVYGSIFRFEGQASLFWPPHGPCYRCLYPEPPPPGMVPSCEEGGVLGVVPGIVGSIQAVEAIKLILGRGRSLAGRLLLIDSLGMEFRELRLRRNPECRVCGENPSVRELIDYEGFCGMRSGMEMEIAPGELSERMRKGAGALLLDVRETWEWDVSRLEGAEHVPMGRLQEELERLPREREIIVYCRSGSRSARAAALLRNAGFRDVKNLSGGLARWSLEIDPSMRVA